MPNIHHYACLLPLLLCLSQPACAADDLMASQMADEARQWQQKDRDDLAAPVWRKLLRAAPQHPEALVNLGLLEARAGNLAQASALLARARQLPRAPAGILKLDSAVDRLAKAKAPPAVAAAPVAKTRPLATPVPAAPRAYPAATPAAPAPAAKVATLAAIPARAQPAARTRAQAAAVALAPFQTQSARGENWAASRARLEQLVQANPNDPVYLLALARHLGHIEASRREALRQLAALAARRDSPAGTASAWRDVLLQLAPRAGDEPLYAQFQARFSSETTFAARRGMVVSGAGSPDERDGASQAAMVRLERAMVQDPSSGAVRVALARQYELLGRWSDAENLLDALLSAEPDLHAAVQARARMYGQLQRWAEGLELLERIAPARRDAAMQAEQRALWIGAQLERARQSAAAGDTQGAAAIVTTAQQAAGAQPAQLVQVAATWNEIGHPARGLRLLREQLGRAATHDSATRITYARMLLDNFEDVELDVVLRDLATPGRLTPGQRAAFERIALIHALRQAEQLRGAGRLADAAARLSPLLERSPDPRLLVAMARIRRAAGDPASALVLVEQAIAREGAVLGHRLLACELTLALNNLTGAQAHASAALALAPRHPRALASAGRVARMRGNLAEAQSYFQRAHAAERDPAALSGAAGDSALRLVDEATPDTGARDTINSQPTKTF